MAGGSTSTSTTRRSKPASTSRGGTKTTTPARTSRTRPSASTTTTKMTPTKTTSTKTTPTKTTPTKSSGTTITTTNSRAKQQMEELRKQQQDTRSVAKGNTADRSNSRSRQQQQQRVSKTRSQSRDNTTKMRGQERITKDRSDEDARKTSNGANTRAKNGSVGYSRGNNVANSRGSRRVAIPESKSTAKSNERGKNAINNGREQIKESAKASSQEAKGSGQDARASIEEVGPRGEDSLRDSEEPTTGKTIESSNLNNERDFEAPIQNGKSHSEVREVEKEEEHEEVLEEEENEDDDNDVDEEIVAEIEEHHHVEESKERLSTNEVSVVNKVENEEEEYEYEDDFDPYEDDDFEDDDDNDNEDNDNDDDTEVDLKSPKPAVDSVSKPSSLSKSVLRANALLSMIHLDISSATLLTLPPIAYEKFMQAFGRTSGVQLGVQTGDDDVDTEMQTEMIEQTHKWTQKPVHCTLDTKHNIQEMIRGVGHDNTEMSTWSSSMTTSTMTSSSNMGEWLEQSVELMNALLLEHHHVRRQEADPDEEGHQRVDQTLMEVVQRTRPVTVYKEKAVRALSFSSTNKASSLLMSLTYLDDDVYNSTLISVWRVFSNLLYRHLVCRAKVVVADFSPDNSIVVGGGNDGSIVVFDLKENKNNVNVQGLQAIPAVFVTPTGTAHLSNVVGIVIMASSSSSSTSSSSSFQLVSTESSGQGRVLVWTVLRKVSSNEEDLGRSPWGSVSLTLTKVVALELERSVLIHALVGLNTHLLLALDDGNVAHVDTHDQDNEEKTDNDKGKSEISVKRRASGRWPKMFKGDFESGAAVTVLTLFPFNKMRFAHSENVDLHDEGDVSVEAPLFLAGGDDGRVRLHSLSLEKPLVSWLATIDGTSVTALTWSSSRPCVFVVLDKLSRLHIWDLGRGDLYPTHSLQLNHVSALALSSVREAKQHRGQHGRREDEQILALGREDGVMELHLLKDHLVAQHPGEQKAELERFLHYISIV